VPPLPDATGPYKFGPPRREHSQWQRHRYLGWATT
jgi:hypothetical protein